MRPFFVEISGYKQIKYLLNEKHFIVIKGNPGDGKTTIATHAMFELMKNGKQPLQLHSYKEFDECISPNQNLVIFIDNFFGEFSVSKDDVAQWSCRSKALEAAVCEGHRRNYIIIAIRNDIYQEGRKLLKSDDFLESNMVDISYGCKFGLSSEDMRQLFTNYTNCSIPEDTFFDNLPKLGFPQCCRLYRDTKELQQNGLQFFNNPLTFLIKEIESRLNEFDMKMAVLVCILLYGGSVKSSTLYDNSLDTELKRTSMNICCVENNLVKFQTATSYISFTKKVQELNEEVITFSHSSVKNAIFLVIGKRSPHDLLNHCNFRLLSMITTSKCRNQEIDSLEIPDSCISTVCDRIGNLLQSDVFSSTFLKVISELYIWNDTRVFEECLKFDNLFVHAIDDKGWSMLVYFSAVGCMKWIKHLYNKFSKDQALLALKVASGANELEVVKFIVSKRCAPNIECCFNAVKGGHLNIILELVLAGVDLTEKCETQTHWLTTTSVLDEAAMQNQCHLIEPLLKECPKLINVKSSIGATAVHFVAQAGDISLLRKIISMPEFSPYDVSDIGSTILHFACQNNKYEAVQYIINEYPLLLSENYYCYDQGTILHTAAQSGNAELFKYVLRQNEKLLEENYVETMQLYRDCHVMIDNKKQTSVHKSKILHIRDGEGCTVLHKAVWSQSIKLVEFIVSQGVDIVSCISNTGLNVVDYMYAKKRTDVDEMLVFLKDAYNIEETKHE
ncbi:unnamed protein product [Mytilus coruscus]|uniref:Novel STAND NTPase 3 domain-containing protein n=1 Tax=Mytilus coruscus TaxID=42192 RepID=A0A6J7ZZL9_MYTCO|nr:unnamed protein product [Mytilus coruscus]